MTVVVGDALVSVAPTTKGFGKALEDQVGGETGAAAKGLGDRAGSGLLGGLTGHLGGVAALVGGAFAAVKVTGFLSGAVGEAREAAKEMRLTEQVIQTTGGAAGLTADQMSDLAGSMAIMSGVDDDVVLNGERVLATFTGIKNGVGEGNDIFNQATETALNMSAALGQDMQGSVVQLGKALNDPVKGVTALSKVGVSFTAQQKEQIKTLQESGDTLGAQKIILKELQVEFGGAAKAAADPIAQFQFLKGELVEAVGTGIMPAVSAIATQLLPVLAELAEPLGILGSVIGEVLGALGGALAPILGSLSGPLGVIGDLVSGLAPTFALLGQTIGVMVDAFGGLFATVAPLISTVFGAFGTVLAAVGGALAQVASVLAEALAPVIEAIMPFIQKFGDLLATVITSALAALLPAFDALIGIFHTMAPSLGVLLDAWTQMQGAVLGLLPVLAQVVSSLVVGLAPILPRIVDVLALLAKTVGGVLSQLLSRLAPVLPVIADALVSVASAIADGLLDLIVALADAIMPLLPVVIDLAVALAQGLADTLADIAPVVVDVVKALASGLLPVIQSLLPLVNPLVKLLVPLAPALIYIGLGIEAVMLAEKAWTAIQLVLNAVLSANPIGIVVIAIAALVAGLILAWQHSETFRAIVTAIGNAIMTVLKAAIDWIVNTAWPAVINFFKAVGDAIGGVINFFKELPGNILGALGDVGGWLVDTGKNIIKGLLDGFILYLELVKKFYIDLPIAILGYIGDAAVWLVQKGIDTLVGLVKGYWDANVQVAEFFTGLAGRVIGYLADAASWLIGRGMETVRGFFQGVRQVWDTEVSFITGIRDRILSAIGSAGRWLYGIGQDIVQGLIDGIWAMFGRLGDAVGGIAGKVTGGLGGLLHLGSPSKLMRQYGMWTVEGFEQGLQAASSGLDPAAIMGLDQFAAPDLSGMRVSATPPDPGSVAGAGFGLRDVSLTVNEARTPPRQTLGDLEWALRTAGR